MSDALTIFGNAVMLSGLPASLAFTALYGLKSNWRVRGVGRALFWLATAMTTFQIIFLVAILWPDMPGRIYIRIAAYGFVSFTIWRMLYELLRVQARERAALRRGNIK